MSSSSSSISCNKVSLLIYLSSFEAYDSADYEWSHPVGRLKPAMRSRSSSTSSSSSSPLPIWQPFADQIRKLQSLSTPTQNSQSSDPLVHRYLILSASLFRPTGPRASEASIIPKTSNKKAFFAKAFFIIRITC